jgi:hypothetical protein
MYVYREERRWNIKLCCSVFYNNCSLFGATLFYVTSKEFATLLYTSKTPVEKDTRGEKFLYEIPEQCFPNLLLAEQFWLLKIITDTHTLAHVNIIRMAGIQN